MNRFSRKDFGVLALLLVLTYGFSSWLGGRHDDADGAALRAQARPGDILMIGSVGCVYCAKARRVLDAQQVPYRECLIERDADCLREFQARGAQGTPTFVVRNRTVVGFDTAAILKALAGSES